MNWKLGELISPGTAGAFAMIALESPPQGMSHAAGRRAGCVDTIYRVGFGYLELQRRALEAMVAYEHPSGAVIWVKLDERTERVVFGP